MTADRTHVEWREWGPEPFAAARSAETPVLLSLTATWCRGCHAMDAETYAEPRIAAIINDGFVPVRVDIDRRPRVRERYNMGGFPSTVFCTPDGRVITGAGYLSPDGLRQVLGSVRETWSDRGDDAGRLPRALAGDPTPAGTVDDRIEAHLAGQLDEQWDERFGGWGEDAKFPLPRTIEFALKRARPKAVRTLRTVSETLRDDDGGFYRYAGARDWSEPHTEKLLADNAALLRAFANGYLYTGAESLLDPAVEARSFLVDRLWNGSAFGGSVAPEASTDADGSGPRRDLTAYAGANAAAAEALLTLVAYTDDGVARDYAERVLETLAATFVADGVVAHVAPDDADGEYPEGLLEDHARVAAAFATARQVLGPDALPADPMAVARRVADEAVETLQEPDGAFRDGPGSGVGLLAEPLRPLDGGIEMAEALLDLAAIGDVVGGGDSEGNGDRAPTGRPYAEVAHDAVAAFAGARERMGVQVAGYGAVASRLTRPDPVIAVGGDAGTDLHRAALRVADHEAVVVPAAPTVPAGVASVRRGSGEREVTTPDGLLDAVAALTDG
jgi:uncharacterized protein YyaL (SSP411 family)